MHDATAPLREACPTHQTHLVAGGVCFVELDFVVLGGRPTPHVNGDVDVFLVVAADDEVAHSARSLPLLLLYLRAVGKGIVQKILPGQASGGLTRKEGKTPAS
eukprot:scaffold16436_cov18-Tisochrysis_lutea.AAC.3